MRVFVDSRTLNAPFLSGVPLYLLELLKEFASRDDGNEYVLLSNEFFSREPVLERFGFPEEKFSELNFNIPNRPANFLAEWFGFPRFARDADIAWSPHIIPLRTKGKIPQVLTVHDIAYVRNPEWFSFKERFWHALPRPKFQARRAAKIIAVSESTKSDLIKYWGIDPGKIIVTYLGIHDEYLGETEESASSKWNDVKAPFILSLGTLQPRKNYIKLISAFDMIAGKEAFKDLNLFIVGSKGWLWKPILNRAKKSVYADRIKFLGNLPNADVAALHRKAKAFVFPSYFEGFGFPPIEAQSCGCPVVSSLEGGLLEALGDSAYVVDPKSTPSIARGIEKVLTDESLRNDLIARGRENAKRFSWEKCADETLAIFKNACGK